MRTALFWKRVDVWAQIAAIFIPIVVMGIKDEPVYLLLGYLTVGGAQVVSCIINKVALDPFYKTVGRRYYEIVLLLVVIMTVVFYSMANDLNYVWFIWYFCMLFIGIVMALWYAVLTVSELDRLKMQVDRKQYI